MDWISFLKTHKGQGLSPAELSAKYRKSKSKSKKSNQRGGEHMWQWKQPSQQSQQQGGCWSCT